MDKNQTLRQKDDFNFPIGKFSFLCSNIQAGPAQEAYVTQMI
jgi:hypothetical protein